MEKVKVFEILMKYNSPWSKRAILLFGISMVMALWLAGTLVKRKRILVSQAIAGVLLLAFLWIVFEATVFSRSPRYAMEYELQLFWSWKEVFNGNFQMLEYCLLNILLLVPAGSLLPFLFRKKHSTVWGLVFGMFISIFIETFQLIFTRGLCEWDDVLHNSIGCMVGYWIGRSVKICLSKYRWVVNFIKGKTLR